MKTLKKPLSILLSILMALGMFTALPVVSSAYNNLEPYEAGRTYAEENYTGESETFDSQWFVDHGYDYTSEDMDDFIEGYDYFVVNEYTNSDYTEGESDGYSAGYNDYGDYIMNNGDFWSHYDDGYDASRSQDYISGWQSKYPDGWDEAESTYEDLYDSAQIAHISYGIDSDDPYTSSPTYNSNWTGLADFAYRQGWENTKSDYDSGYSAGYSDKLSELTGEGADRPDFDGVGASWYEYAYKEGYYAGDNDAGSEYNDGYDAGAAAGNGLAQSDLDNGLYYLDEYKDPDGYTQAYQEGYNDGLDETYVPYYSGYNAGHFDGVEGNDYDTFLQNQLDSISDRSDTYQESFAAGYSAGYSAGQQDAISDLYLTGPQLHAMLDTILKKTSGDSTVQHFYDPESASDSESYTEQYNAFITYIEDNIDLDTYLDYLYRCYDTETIRFRGQCKWKLDPSTGEVTVSPFSPDDHEQFSEHNNTVFSNLPANLQQLTWYVCMSGLGTNFVNENNSGETADYISTGICPFDTADVRSITFDEGVTYITNQMDGDTPIIFGKLTEVTVLNKDAVISDAAFLAEGDIDVFGLPGSTAKTFVETRYPGIKDYADSLGVGLGDCYFNEIFYTSDKNVIVTDDSLTVQDDDTGFTKFGLGSSLYTNLKTLGVQKKTDGDTNDMRFITAVNSGILKDSKVADYGYIALKVTELPGINNDVIAAADGMMSSLTLEMLEASGLSATNKVSCKGTSNNLSGDYGTYSAASDYKYVTFGVNNIDADSLLAVRFYITTTDGLTYYSTYTNSNDVTYDGCAAIYSLLS